MDKQDLEIRGILSQKVQTLIDEVSAKVIERDELVKLLILSIFARSHVFLIGKPGTGKTYIINIILKAVADAKYFDYLVMHQTKPEEIFGTMITDAEGNLVYNYKNSVLDSHFVMLDEMFKGQSSILNALLGITSNDRTFTMRGKGTFKVPLITLFGASNEFPTDDALEPFDDRLLIRYDVERIKEPENYKRLIAGDYDHSKEIKTKVSLKDLEMCDIFSKEFVRIPDNIVDIYSTIKQKIIQDRIQISDRKLVTTMHNILKSAAYLNQRDYVNYSDLLLLKNIAWRDYTDKRKIKEILFNTIFGTKKTFENKLVKIDEDLNNLSNFYNHEVKDFVNRLVPMTASNFELIYSQRMQKVDEFIKVLQVLDSNLSMVENKMSFNKILEKEIQENIFLLDFKGNVFVPEIIVEMEKSRHSINQYKYVMEAFIDGATDAYEYYNSTGNS
ncbi:MAG: Putative MoxR-like ATPase [uncultured Campylobacterales bacterium]|uniref:MoxR-like ATPase n=1 Tax=uncultured Campylobacterales bacterium TaxID=352960 RepID=A0A6S6TIL6_9BACT|nr:MAG: Putative MoxR-like ATPase [uncultured Campylobacterales bacterium]